MDESRARRLLTDELAQLDAVGEEEAEDRAERADPDELRGGMDYGDRGSRITEAMEGDLALGTNALQRERIVAALRRLDEGTYGRCAICGRQIDDERLDARPETDRCREHADTR